jgi:endogenous inhibitor of DNA gyrase (YacG/DUF329 family)
MKVKCNRCGQTWNLSDLHDVGSDGQITHYCPSCQNYSDIDGIGNQHGVVTKGCKHCV